MIWDITYIGAGPSTMFSVLKLLENNYTGNILIIEKGKSLNNRPPKEVISGVFGAGTFSDSKLSVALDVGGNIPNLTQEELDSYSNWILDKINEYGKKLNIPTFKWDETTPYDTKDSGLKWNIHKTCHIGTDNGRRIYKEIENYISTKPNVKIQVESEVKNIICKDGLYQVVALNNQAWSYTIETKKVVLATGQKSSLPDYMSNQFKLNLQPRAFQVGIRVQDTMNDDYVNIIKANYDFKFEDEYEYDSGVKVRVRTFCCNSGNAYVCEEKTPYNFVCFNGHSFKEPDPNNHFVNYGIMCEVTGLKDYVKKDNQIQLMRDVNNLDYWYEDNYTNDINTGIEIIDPKRKLLNKFPQLVGVYPDEVILSLEKFVNKLSNLIDLNKAYYAYPEIKLNGEIPYINPKTFETTQPNLYMIGDCAYSRGIVKAGIEGILFAENLK